MEATAISIPRHSSIQLSINGRLPPRIPTVRYSCLSPSSTHVRSSSLFFSDRFLSKVVPRCASLHDATNHPTSSSDGIAVLLEVDGVLMDTYRSGNRQAFNVAFQKLGLDCAKWMEPIYSDLLRKSGGDEERMLALYFNRTGWPTSLPTSEKDTFIKSVLLEKKKALADFVLSKDALLRPGVEKFVDDACEEGIHVVILTKTSKLGEETARAIVEKLATGRMSKLKVVGEKEIGHSFFGQLVLGLQNSSGLQQDLANEANKAAAAERKRIAEEVASILKLSVNINTDKAERG